MMDLNLYETIAYRISQGEQVAVLASTTLETYGVRDRVRDILSNQGVRHYLAPAALKVRHSGGSVTFASSRRVYGLRGLSLDALYTTHEAIHGAGAPHAGMVTALLVGRDGELIIRDRL